MGNYIILIRDNGIFKIITYCGNFIDFLNECKYKIYFKIRVPSFLVFRRKLKISWYKRFCEDLYFLHISGVSIIDSISIFKQNAENSKNKKMSLFYKVIYDKLIKGNSLYKSIKSTKYEFDNIFLSLIKISEETGNLSEILKNLFKYYEEKILINNKVKSSLLYPTLLSGVLFILFNLCILYFIPNYVDSFQSQFSNLPSYSLVFINACLFINDNYGVFLIIMLLFLLIFIKSFRVKGFLTKFFLKISLFRKIYFKYCQLKFIQALYYMINSGIDISKALKIMSSIKSELYAIYSKYVYEQINQGFDFCEALKSAKIFESEVISIIKVGEKSSNLNLSLKNIWTGCSKKYYQIMDRSTKLIEPIFILICGLSVIIFVSIFILPLISYDNFSHIWEGI